MPQSATLLYVHFIWATWDRAPVIKLEWENRIYSCIRDKCLELRCEALAVGGIENHLHVLVRMHADMAVSQLAKAMKGTSSFLINHELSPHQEFKWQGGYGALTVSRTHVTKNSKLHSQPKRTSQRKQNLAFPRNYQFGLTHEGGFRNSSRGFQSPAK